MNILFHCSEYPDISISGGIGTVTKIVSEELARRGHKVYVVGYYPDMKGNERVEVINSVTVYMFNYGFRRGKYRLLFVNMLDRLKMAGFIIRKELVWYEKQIDNIIYKHDIQLLELTDYYDFNRYRAQFTFHRFTVPTVLRVHGCMSFTRHYKGKLLPSAIDNDKAHFLRTDYLCSVSHFSQQYIDNTFNLTHFKRKKVIYNPVEKVLLKDNYPSGSKSILFLGKIIRTKGAFQVIKAFNKVAEEFSDWQLRMLGDGSIVEARKFVDDAISERVHFLGFCNRETVKKEIDACSFACIPSFFENFSMAPLEIMGRSRAVIFTNRTSGNEIINNGVDGFTVNPEDVEDIYCKMKILIQDVELRDLFAKRGYDKVSNQFTTDKIVDELECYYEECIEDKPTKNKQ